MQEIRLISSNAYIYRTSAVVGCFSRVPTISKVIREENPMIHEEIKRFRVILNSGLNDSK